MRKKKTLTMEQLEHREVFSVATGLELAEFQTLDTNRGMDYVHIDSFDRGYLTPYSYSQASRGNPVGREI